MTGWLSVPVSSVYNLRNNFLTQKDVWVGIKCLFNKFNVIMLCIYPIFLSHQLHGQY